MDNINLDIPSINVTALLTVIIPFFVALLLSRLINRYIKIPKNLESPRTKTYLATTQSLLTMFIYIVAAYYVLTQLNINVTPLFASAGVLGIIIGLGVRSFIEDFFTGILILTQDTISVGDYVEIGGAQGITEAVGLRTVRLKDQNGAIHIFPNREIKKIVNYSRRLARVVVDVPIKSNQPVDRSIRALEQAIEELKKDKVLSARISEGSHVQGVERITGNSIAVRVLIITRAAFRWDTARRYRYLALRQLEKTKIELG